MAQFVIGFGNKASGSPFINLDHVVRLQPLGDGRGYDCLGSDMESLGRIDAGDVPDINPGVVPDTTGTVLIAFYLAIGEEPIIERSPVVAWVVKEGVAEPVICDELPAVYCLESRDGADGKLWTFPFDCTCVTWEVARRRGLERLGAKRVDIVAEGAPSQQTGDADVH